jgi:hypothetical protein
VTIRALGQNKKIVVDTPKKQYKIGDKLNLCIWVGNSAGSEEILTDAFIGLGKPDGSLLFLDPSLNLNPSDTLDSKTFTPFVQGIAIPPGFVFPGPKEVNIDTDNNGKEDGYTLYSLAIDQGVPAGQYFAFAALAEAGSVQIGMPKIIGDISISGFSVTK